MQKRPFTAMLRRFTVARFDRPGPFLFYFSRGYITKPKPHGQNKRNNTRSGSPNTNNTTPLQQVQDMQTPIAQRVQHVQTPNAQPVKMASRDDITTDDSNNAMLLQSVVKSIAPVVLPIQNRTTHPDIAKHVNDTVILQSIENVVSPIALQTQEASNEHNCIHMYSSLSPVELEPKVVHVISTCGPSRYADPQTINQDFKKLQIEPLVMPISSPPPVPSLKQAITTTQAYNYNMFYVVDDNYGVTIAAEDFVYDDKDQMDIADVRLENFDKEDADLIRTIQDENRKIIADWDEKVVKLKNHHKELKKKLEELRKETNTVNQQLKEATTKRQDETLKLHKKLNDIIAMLKLKKSRIHSKKSVKRPGMKIMVKLQQAMKIIPANTMFIFEENGTLDQPVSTLVSHNEHWPETSLTGLNILLNLLSYSNALFCGQASEGSDHVEFLLPIMKTNIDKSYEILQMSVQIPNIPLHRVTSIVLDDFCQY
ncbi:unnamed protein product [Rotaria magnacalcarata]|uniref:Uncharacterized protein n=2 Tax=Rotaria magnacalcarata TaxID=392030 RepID=A0A814IS74_9BILA|nr:unnamed protein product [Rotaria magnacalcarata]CAF1611919.1 unnamed protein product [Rotaria magnacalcarata]